MRFIHLICIGVSIAIYIVTYLVMSTLKMVRILRVTLAVNEIDFTYQSIFKIECHITNTKVPASYPFPPYLTPLTSRRNTDRFTSIFYASFTLYETRMNFKGCYGILNLCIVYICCIRFRLEPGNLILWIVWIAHHPNFGGLLI